MRCVLVGREARDGKNKEGKRYDFVKLYIAGEKQGVEGQATDSIILSRDRYPDLCRQVMTEIQPGEVIEVTYTREIGSTMDIIADIQLVPALAVVED